jgi:hypothetical protein
MGLGYQKSRRHAASDRRVIDRLNRHAAWMKHFIDQGMAKDDASAAAYKKVIDGLNPPADLEGAGQ